MKTSIATVIKTGNSYALRVPMSYAERNNLRPGAKVRLPDPQSTGGTLADLQAIMNKAHKNGGIPEWEAIDDPVEWQRKERSEWDD